ncbi:3-methyladenine DNA glycosylase AlkD [Enterococcus rotai]|uniref:DNA alkylation repair protein n=1 Tax=Enterococcus rotai TaxID=118060 RepID=A0A0U2X7I2_9ENTE|nr:DNA alkylation repair protein [Enterococcus rotai]ALS36024.1 DNA alkylation repair protein [Enterococcus rotai]
MTLEEELKEIANVPNGFKPMEHLADSLEKERTEKELEELAFTLYASEIYQIRMVAVFLFGKRASNNREVLNFLKKNVSKDDNWRVQEILGMAFDHFCKEIGYEEALVTIKEWLNFENSNTRRAVSEGLRIWTSRPYFKDNPDSAIRLLSTLKNDDSEYVRKSCGNALRDISKKYPEKIMDELSLWQGSKEELQIEKIIFKNKNLGHFLNNNQKE